MSRKTNASAAELARRIEQHLPVFARPTLEQLIAAVQRETRAGSQIDPSIINAAAVEAAARRIAAELADRTERSAGEAHAAHD